MLVNHESITFSFSLNINTCSTPCQLGNPWPRGIFVEIWNSQRHNCLNGSIMVNFQKNGGYQGGTICLSIMNIKLYYTHTHMLHTFFTHLSMARSSSEFVVMGIKTKTVEDIKTKTMDGPIRPCQKMLGCCMWMWDATKWRGEFLLWYLPSIQWWSLCGRTFPLDI
jgi:hypothetical protein